MKKLKYNIRWAYYWGASVVLDVSIIIPTWNQKSNYLAEAVGSALNQTYPEEKFEVIVVDDGSTKVLPDATVQRFSKNKNIHLVKKPHGGTAHSLNAGINQMRGKYFKWLSSDDALYPNTLELLMQNAPNEKQIVYGNWTVINSKSEPSSEFIEAPFSDVHDMRRKLWQNFYGNATASLIPRDAFKRVGLFDESLPYFEDYDWWLRAVFIHNFQLSNCNRVVAKYRFHEGQLTAQLGRRDIQKLLCRWRIKRRVYEKLDQKIRADAVPKPSITSLTRRMFIFDIAYVYRKIAGSTQNGRARTPSKIRYLIKRFF